MTEPVTVVVIYSLSYTGTTWLNYVLGSHPDVFGLGPCDRPMGLARAKAGEACRVHGPDCPFWPRFYQTWEKGENFFIHLARTSGKRVIVTNNPLPQGGGRELEHRDIVVRPIHFVRDGRAVADSYASKFPEKAFLEVCKDWLAPSFNEFAWDPDDPDRLCLRYEDVLADQRGMLERVGRLVGIGYDESALRFWEHEHHPAAGNQGPIFMIKQFQGIATGAHARDRAFYQEQYNKLRENPEHQFEADRWRERRSDRELFVFDVICGRRNAELGYGRDRFTAEQWETYSTELGRELGRPLPRVGSFGGGERAKGPSGVASAEAKPVVSGERRDGPGGRPGPFGAVLAVIVFGVALGVVSMLAASGVFG